MKLVDLYCHPGCLTVSKIIFGFGIELNKKKSGFEVGCVTEIPPCIQVLGRFQVVVEFLLVSVRVKIL